MTSALDWLVPLARFREALAAADAPFVTGLAHGTMTVELYRPVGRDRQTPHVQDELYIVMAGRGTFFRDGVIAPFGPGDVIFVPAGMDHRFETFSDDFETYVIFWGPKGGEAAATGPS